MSKRPSGNDRKKKEAGRPAPSDINKKKNNKKTGKGKSSDASRRPDTRSAPKGKKDKNELSLDGDRNYGDEFSYPDLMDRETENILKKPQRESGLHYLKPLPPAKAPGSPYKRKVKRILFYTLTLVLLLTVCCVLSLTVFFKIDDITVEGESRYSDEDIIGASMISLGDNLILCNTSPGEGEIWERFPYIENVDIHKKLFNKIIITVREAVPSSVIESDGKYVLLSESGKIIDISGKKQADVPIIMGAKLANPRLSSSVKYKDSSVEDYIKSILEGAGKYSFGVLRVIDISNLSRIVLTTNTGLNIVLGTPDNIDHKMNTAKRIIDEKSISNNAEGVLDVSLSAAEGGKSYFSIKKPEEESSREESSKPKEASKQESSKPEESSSEQSEEQNNDGTGEESSYDEEVSYDDGGTGDNNDGTGDNNDENSYSDEPEAPTETSSYEENSEDNGENSYPDEPENSYSGEESYSDEDYTEENSSGGEESWNENGGGDEWNADRDGTDDNEYSEPQDWDVRDQ